MIPNAWSINARLAPGRPALATCAIWTTIAAGTANRFPDLRRMIVDFHSIPFHGEDALLEKHYLSKRSRRQKGVLAFLAQDAERRVFCYASAEIAKADQADHADEVLRFVEFWQARTGTAPEELDFRLQTDHSRQPRHPQPGRHQLHHPAPRLRRATRRTP